MVSEQVGLSDQVVVCCVTVGCCQCRFTNHVFPLLVDEKNMAGRNDAAIAAALQAVAQAIQNQPNAGGNDEFRKNKPPIFKGRYDPDGAQIWLKEMERIFRVMDCAEEHKVRLGTHMLTEEADDWWVSTRHVWEATGEVVTWALFSREFLRKYFPEDVRGKKKIEFLELK